MKAQIHTILALFTLIGFTHAKEIEETIVVQPQPLPGQQFRASENSHMLAAGTYLLSLEMPAGVTVSVNLDIAGPDPTVITNAKAGGKYTIVVEPKTIPESKPAFMGSRGIYFGDLKGATGPVSIKLILKKIQA
jgi:hypothetical protein